MNSQNFPKLKGRENYRTWVISAKSYLTVKDLWKYTLTIPDMSADESVKQKHERCLAELTLLIEPKCYSYIEGAGNPKAAWDMISKAFSDNGVARHSQILQDLVAMKRNKCFSMEDYVQKMTVLYQKTKACGFDIGENVVASLMLGGLSEEYKPLMYGLGKDSKNLTLDFVQNLLLQEIDSNIKQSDETALAAGSKKNSRKKKKIKCYNCGGDHFTRFCKKENKNNKRPEKPAHTILCATLRDSEFSESESACELAYESVFFNTNGEKGASSVTCNISTFYAIEKKREWLLDSGATAHMCNDEMNIKNPRAPQKRNVIIANNETIEIKFVGCVDECLKVAGKKSLVRIDDVQCIPDICANLLSVSKLVKRKYKVVFDINGAKIYNEHKTVIATASLVNDLFKLDTFIEDEYAAFASEAILWHKRLGHVSVSNMSFLEKDVKGIEIPSHMDCKICTQCKRTHLPFKKDGIRAVSLLQIIQSDVCGPMYENSIGGAKYYVSFIDDFSRKVFVYIIKQKSQVFECFKKFKALVENQTDKKIKIFRSDGGKEYDNHQFRDLFEQEGVAHQKTAPFNPEQYGLAERMNRSIMEKVRCMLYGASLSKDFWAEAVKYAVDVINVLPNAANRENCPDEIWFGLKPNLKKFKVFGCKAYAHIPDQRRTQLEMKSTKCIFIGFPENTNAYKLYNTSTKNVIISRNAVFFEKQENDENETTTVKSNGNFDMAEAFPDDEDIVETTEPEGAMHQDDIGADVYDESPGNNSEERSSDEKMDENDAEITPSQFVDAPHDETIPSPMDNYQTDPTYSDRALDPNTERSMTRGFDPFGMFNSHVAFIAIPKTVKEALESPHAKEWKNAMKLEMDSLKENETRELTKLPNENETVLFKWAFSTKTDEMGNILRFKARLVAQGFSQEFGIDYTEAFSPVVKYSTIRFVLALAAARDLKVTQMNAVTDYQNGCVNETIFMEQLMFFDDKTRRVCKRKKSIYGLKQSGKNWNDTLNSFLLEIGMKRCGADQCLYFANTNENTVIVLVWVDDFIIVTSNEDDVKWLVTQLSKRFKMKHLGTASKNLEMRVSIEKGSIKLDQKKRINKILEKFSMTNCKAVSTPMEIGKKLARNRRFLHEDDFSFVDSKYVSRYEMIADVLTRGLFRKKHCGLAEKFGPTN